MDEDSFLTENPLTVLKEGRGSRVPWMVGVNSMEGVFVSAGAAYSVSFLTSYILCLKFTLFYSD